MCLLGSGSRSETGSETSSAPEMNLTSRMAVHMTSETAHTRQLTQTSFPTPSIQFPNWLTLLSHSLNRTLIPSICPGSKTFGCTQFIRAISATWSILPLNSPKLKAFMIKISISAGATFVSFEIVWNVMARSCGGRRNTASVSAAREIFWYKNSLCWSSCGALDKFASRTL